MNALVPYPSWARFGWERFFLSGTESDREFRRQVCCAVAPEDES